MLRKPLNQIRHTVRKKTGENTFHGKSHRYFWLVTFCTAEIDNKWQTCCKRAMASFPQHMTVMTTTS